MGHALFKCKSKETTGFVCRLYAYVIKLSIWPDYSTWGDTKFPCKQAILRYEIRLDPGPVFIFCLIGFCVRVEGEYIHCWTHIPLWIVSNPLMQVIGMRGNFDEITLSNFSNLIPVHQGFWKAVWRVVNPRTDHC